MMQTYFDNAATSFPKPDSVLEAIVEYQTNSGASPGRGAYASASSASDMLEHCRSLLIELAHAPIQTNCIFTLNCSEALNLAILGIARNHLDAKRKVHIVTTAMDHNSVLRPLEALKEYGVSVTIVPADKKSGRVDPTMVARAITPDTRLVAVAHGSNVTGTVQDIGKIGQLCGDVPFLVDAAQTFGHFPINMQSMKINLLAFPGHKGLLGPLGTGGLIMSSGMERYLTPIRYGGTGSKSESPIQPQILPDKYESGSHNMVGLAGLCAGVEWVLSRGVESLHRHETALCEQFIDELANYDVQIIGPQTSEQRCGVFSLDFGENPHDIANNLEEQYGIQTRAGLHCAPFAHETMGTSECGGTVRISFGPFHSPEDVTFLTQSINHATEKVLL